MSHGPITEIKLFQVMYKYMAKTLGNKGARGNGC